MTELEYIMRFLRDLEKHFEGVRLSITVKPDFIRLRMCKYPFVDSKRYYYDMVCDSFPGAFELTIAADVKQFCMDCMEVNLNDED